MRVTIEHRETTAGVLGKHKDCYVDCRVEFNEEENAIIKAARSLQPRHYDPGATPPADQKRAIVGTGMHARRRPPHDDRRPYLRAVCRLRRHPDRTMAHCCSLSASVSKSAAGMRHRTEDKRFEVREQQITVKQLLDESALHRPHLRPRPPPKASKMQIRENLSDLKNLIANSAELRAKQTFEL